MPSGAETNVNKCRGQRSFSAGTFAIGGLFGIQNTTISHPWTTVLLTSILRGADPLHRFSSLTLQRNVMVHMHQDNNNEPGFPNLIVPCSRWRGGCLWVQAAGGAHALDQSSGPGTMIRIAWPGITFSPTCAARHYSMEQRRPYYSCGLPDKASLLLTGH